MQEVGRRQCQEEGTTEPLLHFATLQHIARVPLRLLWLGVGSWATIVAVAWTLGSRDPCLNAACVCVWRPVLLPCDAGTGSLDASVRSVFSKVV
jgi:hypothetical protein